MEADRLEALLVRVRGGDREALDELVRHFDARVRGRIRRRLGPDLRARVDTDDIYQSTIAASLRGLADLDFESEEAFLAWLTKVAERRVVDAARRHRAGRRDVRRQENLGSGGQLVGDLTSPTQGAVRNETTSNLRRVVERLPAAERRVVELRSIEERGFREIAAEMGLSDRHAARNLFMRALGRMGDLIEIRSEQPED